MADYSGFTFRGIKKDYLTTLKGRKRPSWAPVKRNIITVPGKPGGYLESTDTDIRVIPVPIRVKAMDNASLQDLKEDLAAWLITENPEELVFDDEPNRFYMAVVDGSLDLDEIVSVGKGTINFIVPDSYKLGPTNVLNFNNAASFTVNGSAGAEPYFRLTMNSDTTYVVVANGEGKLNMIGNPTRVEEVATEAQTPIFMEEAKSLLGWTVSSSESVENADITGTLKSDGNKFFTDDFGTSPIWHGPAMKTSLPEPIQDFRFEMGFNMTVTGYNQAGNIEVSLLDAGNRVLAKLQFTKHYEGVGLLMTKMRAGSGSLGYDVFSEDDLRGRFYDHFEGVLRLYRLGNEWSAHIFELIDGVFYRRATSYWTDYEGIAMAPATQVQVQIMQRSWLLAPAMNIADIQIWRLNDLSDNQVPYIARTGDIVEFDHTTDIIRVNGEDVTSEKAFIGEYFDLKAGQNTITAEPMDSISNVELRWRDRWR